MRLLRNAPVLHYMNSFKLKFIRIAMKSSKINIRSQQLSVASSIVSLQCKELFQKWSYHHLLSVLIALSKYPFTAYFKGYTRPWKVSLKSESIGIRAIVTAIFSLLEDALHFSLQLRIGNAFYSLIIEPHASKRFVLSLETTGVIPASFEHQSRLLVLTISATTWPSLSLPGCLFFL